MVICELGNVYNLLSVSIFDKENFQTIVKYITRILEIKIKTEVNAEFLNRILIVFVLVLEHNFVGQQH